MSGAGLPRGTCSVDIVTAKQSRMSAASMTTSISDRGDELARPSGQWAAIRRTASTAPGSSGRWSRYCPAMASTTVAATASGGMSTPRSSLR
jgi:hypothetical protein